MCGEHRHLDLDVFEQQGSSPRVRGTQGGTRPACPGRGIIPACAGNTMKAEQILKNRRDHPRVCGEHQCPRGHISTSWGSSPRVRGTLQILDVSRVHAGIIPACAGNTLGGRSYAIQSRDHPRVCGEHFSIAVNAIQSRGSSPRVRGTLTEEYLGLGYSGIIPACAGNTKRHSFDAIIDADHPRVCGEH